MFNIIFIGTSEFAVPSLEALIASAHEVVAVVSQPDRPKGRGREMQPTPVKQVAVAHSIPVLQPEKIRDPQAIAQIKEFGPIDLLVVAAYGQKIPAELLEWPSCGAVNVHGSILPKYRGAAPIQHALIAGEQQTGVTTMLMDEGLDTGDILLQASIDIDQHENAGDLGQRLAFLGSRLLLDTLKGMEDGSIASIPQNDELATVAKSLPRDTGVIDWSLAASDIVNRIRGCTPKPGAFTRLNGILVKIWSASVKDADGYLGEPGRVVNVSDGILVAAGSGSVKLKEVQPESRKRMAAAEYARGAKLQPGAQFDRRTEI